MAPAFFMPFASPTLMATTLDPVARPAPSLTASAAPTEPDPPRRRTLIASVAGLTAVFLGLSAAMMFLAPTLLYVYDIWFGTDIPRHVQWTTVSAFVFRGHLHPLTFCLYKTLGALLRMLGIRSDQGVYLPCCLFPALFASVAIVDAAARLGRPGLRLLSGLAGVVLGATLVFAPIPESHTMGGAALVLEGVWVWTALRAQRRGEDDDRAMGRAVLYAGVAAGMTISNAAPGLLLLATLWKGMALRGDLLRRLALAALILAALILAANVALHRSVLLSGSNNLSVEEAWLARPTPYSFWISLSSLWLHLFGLPPSHLTIHKLSWPDQPAYELIYPRMQPAPVQCAAAACWLIGLGLWARRTRRGEPARAIAAACLLSLLGLTAFSSGYDTFEAYMLANHAWPFVLLPALLVLNDPAPDRQAPARWMMAAICLSALQTVLSLPHLFSLLVRL